MAEQDTFSAIRKEQEAFDASLDQMMAEHGGEFVLFKNGQPVEFFGDYQSAYKAGLDNFGLDETFLVSEVKRREPQTTSITWAAGAL